MENNLMPDWRPDPPIYAACKDKDSDTLEAVRALLAAGEDPNATDYRGYPPLACRETVQNPELFTLLLQHGADPSGSSYGNYLLGDLVRSYPFQKSNSDKQLLRQAVEQLLHAGADPNRWMGTIENAPLWIAIQWQWAEIIPTLLKAGADPDRTNDEGHDAMQWAIHCEDAAIIQVLTGLVTSKGQHSTSVSEQCNTVFNEIVSQLRDNNMKLCLVGPGYKYEYEVFHEYCWHNEQWTEVRYDAYVHKNAAHGHVTMLGCDDEALRKRLVHIEQLDLNINKPRVRAWRRLLEERLKKRSNHDLLRRVHARKRGLES